MKKALYELENSLIDLECITIIISKIHEDIGACDISRDKNASKELDILWYASKQLALQVQQLKKIHEDLLKN